jgi:hypothetical protein
MLTTEWKNSSDTAGQKQGIYFLLLLNDCFALFSCKLFFNGRSKKIYRLILDSLSVIRSSFFCPLQIYWWCLYFNTSICLHLVCKSA